MERNKGIIILLKTKSKYNTLSYNRARWKFSEGEFTIEILCLETEGGGGGGKSHTKRTGVGSIIPLRVTRLDTS